jgi:hypothetical protein
LHAAVSQRALDRPRDRFAHDHAHAAADERVLHRGNRHGNAVERARGRDDRVVQAGGLDARVETLAIRLRVREVQRVIRAEFRVVHVVLAVEEQRQALGRVHPEVVRALRAHLQIRDEILVVENLPARRALDP